jgi:pimeloyl-ACP methyl ester carboxylesterase
MTSERVLYLPGAGGEGRFWQPVAELVSHPGETVLFDWPGFGRNPARDDVATADDLYRLVEGYIDRPVDVVAQSMGGLFAMRAALEHPDLVRRLVLVATSGGVHAVREAAEVDWRPEFTASYPQAPSWATDDRTDFTPRLGELQMPVLLLWGGADRVSPPAAGRKLLELLPRAELEVVEGGDHAFAHDRAEEVAPIIRRFLLDTRESH